MTVIRGPDDPERRPREARPDSDRALNAVLKLNQIKKLSVDELKPIIRDALDDGEPRTFNRICVELWDRTADLLFGERPEEALWQLAEAGEVAFTREAPVYFRKAGGERRTINNDSNALETNNMSMYASLVENDVHATFIPGRCRCLDDEGNSWVLLAVNATVDAVSADFVRLQAYTLYTQGGGDVDRGDDPIELVVPVSTVTAMQAIDDDEDEDGGSEEEEEDDEEYEEDEDENEDEDEEAAAPRLRRVV
jgi:hypothetical protein